MIMDSRRRADLGLDLGQGAATVTTSAPATASTATASTTEALGEHSRPPASGPWLQTSISQGTPYTAPRGTQGDTRPGFTLPGSHQSGSGIPAFDMGVPSAGSSTRQRRRQAPTSPTDVNMMHPWYLQGRPWHPSFPDMGFPMVSTWLYLVFFMLVSEGLLAFLVDLPHDYPIMMFHNRCVY